MQITKIPQISFKGYDAAPIKNIYMHRTEADGIVDEMRTVANSEKFNLLNYSTTHCRQWAQDDKFIANPKNSERVLLKEENENCEDFAYKFRELDGIKTKEPKVFLTGGNMFMGKKENGENWLLVGLDEITRTYKPKDVVLENISKEYNVKLENITILDQPQFHLDMAIRPIGYPYVLVNDPKLVIENLKKYKNEIPEEVFEKKPEFYSELQGRIYASCDETVAQLERAGFVPIRIAGNYCFNTSEINYMNAVVNKHDDGTISYITNSGKNTPCEIFDKIFEHDLHAAVKNLKKSYFISGKEGEELDGLYQKHVKCKLPVLKKETKEPYNQKNPMMYILKYMHGGIHCMSLEEPDFEKWGKNENK